MEEAGLTAGAFYAHFPSKQALLAAALTHAGAEATGRINESIARLSGRSWVEGFLSQYLGKAHCERVEDGCPIAALVSDVSRADETVKESFEGMVGDLASRLAVHASADGGTDPERAIAALAMCVGGLALARSVKDVDLVERILGACRHHAEDILCGPSEPPPHVRPPRDRTAHTGRGKNARST
jgi:TetR/AcrR family transcriptional repressor of nem operon